MAQKIIIPTHTVLLTDLQNAAPNGKMKKIFFQCVLKEIRTNGNDLEAHFGLIAYPAKKPFLGDWTAPNKVDCVPDNTQPPLVVDLVPGAEPIGLANKELKQLMHAIKAILRDGSRPTAALTLRPTTSANPHVALDATLDGASERLNPSPPADPY